jgi:hypothetical protein
LQNYLQTKYKKDVVFKINKFSSLIIRSIIEPEQEGNKMGDPVLVLFGASDVVKELVFITRL